MSRLLLIVALLSVPHTSWTQVDPAMIRSILGEEWSHPTQTEDEKSKKLLDTMCKSATKLLDPNNKDWNASSPRWNAIYDRVRADLESEMPSIRTEIKDQAEKLQRESEADIAARLRQSEVDAILAFYRTPEGKRYQEFARRVDHIMSLGMPNVTSLGVADGRRQPVSIVTPEQTTSYIKMLMLSRNYQSIVAASEGQKDPSGYGGVIGLEMGVAIRYNQQELEVLDKEYAGDLASFESFTKTAAAQHLFAAIGESMLRVAQNNSLVGLFRAVEQKHESEWKALYLSQINP